jgi:hypothetical protein
VQFFRISRLLCGALILCALAYMAPVVQAKLTDATPKVAHVSKTPDQEVNYALGLTRQVCDAYSSNHKTRCDANSVAVGRFKKKSGSKRTFRGGFTAGNGDYACSGYGSYRVDSRGNPTRGHIRLKDKRLRCPLP